MIDNEAASGASWERDIMRCCLDLLVNAGEVVRGTPVGEALVRLVKLASLGELEHHMPRKAAGTGTIAIDPAIQVLLDNFAIRLP